MPVPRSLPERKIARSCELIGPPEDRHALPVPDSSGRDRATSFVPPRTPTEELLAGIWAEVLGLEQLGIYDDFFDLGGHSLLAIQVGARVREVFQVELPLNVFLERTTIAAQSELVIAEEFEQADSRELEQILAEVEELSDDELKQLLLAESH